MVLRLNPQNGVIRMTPEDNAAAYIRLFEELADTNLDAPFDGFVNPRIHFKDPFNDFTGLDRFRRLLVKTRADVENPIFSVTHRAWSGEVLFLRWTFSGRVSHLGAWDVEGMSELRFDDQGRVLVHIDYWDASTSFYSHIPVLGWLIRMIRRKLTVL